MAKRKTSKPAKVWLSRDDCSHTMYELWKRKPQKNSDGIYGLDGLDDSPLGAFYRSGREFVTDFTLEPGECCGVTIRIEKCDGARRGD